MNHRWWAGALAALAVSPTCHLAAQTIATVEIERHDVFTGDVARTFYGRLANTLHIVTRDAAIRREILLKPGQPYDSALAAEGARNLRRLGVFRQVRVDTVTRDSGFVLRYVTDDGWSTKTDFRFGSTGNEVTWTVGAYEDNLLGTAAQLAFEHRTTPDRSTNTFLFQRSRLFANRVFVRAEYIDKSDGAVGLLQAGVPWLSIQSCWRAFASAFARDGRVLRFVGGTTEADDSIRRVQTVVRGDLGWAPSADPRRYVRIGVAGQVRRDDTTPWAGPDTVSRTIYGDVQAWTEVSRVRFQVLQGFRTFVQQEDVDLSATARVGLAVAPAAWGYPRTGIGPLVALHGGVALGPDAFLTADLRHNALYASGGLDSSTTLIGTTAGWVAGGGHVLVAHAEAGWKEGLAPGDEFDLGLGVGPRGFRGHAFTGDRSFFLTTEYRYTINPDLWGLMGLGLATFVDHGGAWYQGSERRTGTDLGVGLRIGPSRATSLSVLRVDLAHRFATDQQGAGWVLVIGKGLPFQELR
jgi:surface antigen-like variable number repeat protein